VKAKEINKLKKKGKKMLPGNFTVSEGHGHPLVVKKFQELLYVVVVN
jgi:hypothetical protein